MALNNGALNDGLFTSNSYEWATPQDLFDKLNTEFHFTLDPCATEENKKCEKFYTKQEDGLLKSWENETVFCNPPYGRGIINKWVKKCHDEWRNHNITVVMLIFARTDTSYFHDYIFPHCELRFLRGRVKFVKGNSTNTAPFPSVICIFRGTK